MPELSIIVPVYKVEPYLPKCIDSILAQTFTDFELILIDDGSPDRCGEICDAYAARDSRIIVVHQENKGVSAARNAGLDIAQGKYIGFVDSDDWIEPEMYEILLSNAINKGWQVSCCGIDHFIDSLDATDCDCISGEWIELNRNSIIGDLFGTPSIQGRYSVNKIYNTSLIQRNNYRFCENIRIWEDFCFLIHVLTNVEICSCGQSSLCLYHYRNRPDSVTNSAKGCDFSSRNIVFKDEVFTTIKENAPEYLPQAVSFYLDACVRHIHFCMKCGKKSQWKNIFRAKKSIGEWLLYGLLHRYITLRTAHRFFITGIMA